MDGRRLFGISLLAASAVLTPALTRAAVNIDIRVGPPPAVVEVVPAPRHGYVWAPGYWRWNGSKHVWAKGRWMREQHGRQWVPDHWVERGGRWHFVPGHWG
jgi:hypothetical protein